MRFVEERNDQIDRLFEWFQQSGCIPGNPIIYVKSAFEHLTGYSDGISEAMRSGPEIYGDDRMVRSMRHHGEDDLEMSMQGLLDDARKWTNASRFQVDVTLLGIEFAVHVFQPDRMFQITE